METSLLSSIVDQIAGVALSSLAEEFKDKSKETKFENKLYESVENVLSAEREHEQLYWNDFERLIYNSKIIENYIKNLLSIGDYIETDEKLDCLKQQGKYSDEQIKYFKKVIRKIGEATTKCMYTSMDQSDRILYKLLANLIKKYNEEDTSNTVTKVQEKTITIDSTKESELILEIVLNNDDVGLSDESIEKLKKYSLEDHKEALDIQLKLSKQSLNDIASWLSKYDEITDDFTVEGLKIRLVERFKSDEAKLNLAVQYLLKYSDNILIEEYDLELIEKYGEDELIYLDEYDIKRMYSKVFFWVTIINQMINNRLIKPIKRPSSEGNFSAVFSMIADSGYCFFANLPNERKGLEFISCRAADPRELPPKDRMLLVYPELFYSAAQNHDYIMKNKVPNLKKRLDLYSYYIGEQN